MKRILFLFLTVIVFGALAEATTLQKLSEEVMVREADVIAHGRVAELSSSRLDGQLVTLVEIETLDVLKGTPEWVTVIVLGGVDMSLKHPVATTYPGSPQFLKGQEVFLFLKQSAAMVGGYSVVGFSQGAYQILPSAAGPAARRNLSNVTLVSGSSAVLGGESMISLEAFKEQVRRQLAPQGEPGS